MSEITFDVTCDLDNINPRTEKHGDDDVPAVDLRFSFPLLELTDDALATWLGRMGASTDDIDRLRSVSGWLVNDASVDLIGMAADWTDHRVTIAWNKDVPEDVIQVLDGCEVNTFRLLFNRLKTDPPRLSFRVQHSGADGVDLSGIWEALGSMLHVDVRPGAQQSLDLDGNGDGE